VLREAWAAAPASPVEERLTVVREVAAHAYPTGEPEEIEAEIRAGVPRGLE